MGCYGDICAQMGVEAARREMRPLVPAFQSSDYRVRVEKPNNGLKNYASIEDFAGDRIFTVCCNEATFYGKLSKALLAPCDFDVIVNESITMHIKKGQYVLEKPNGTIACINKKDFNRDYKVKVSSPVPLLIRELDNLWQNV